MMLRIASLALAAAALAGCAGPTNGKLTVDHPIYSYKPPEEIEPEEPCEPDEPEEPEDPDEEDEEE